jgi:succinyl-diaminopimelate desuccinylase
VDRDWFINAVRSRGDEIVALTCRLIRFKTENPPGDTREIADFVQGYLAEAGISTQRFEPVEGRVSLIARVGVGRGRTLAFNGHLDVVPPGDLANWQVDPYGGEVRNGKIWGRGAADMKSKVAAAIVVARVLQELGAPLPGDWMLMLVPDEETGGQHGTRWLVEQGVVHPDAAIVGEGAGRHFGVANKGMLGVNLKVRGRSAHGSRPFEGDNAVERLAAVLPHLHEVERWEPLLPAQVHEIIELSRPFHEDNARKRKVPVERYLWSLSHTTVNVGRFCGGVQRNIVADGAMAELDLRYPPGVTGDEVRGRLEAAVGILNAPGLSMEVVHDFEPFYESLDAEIVQVARNALRTVGVAEDPRPVFKASVNDCRHLKRAGIPSVVLGHDGSGGHVPNEHCGIDELIQTACLYMAVAHEFLTRTGGRRQ